MTAKLMCTKCGAYKNESEFGKAEANTRRRKHSSTCNSCIAIMVGKITTSRKEARYAGDKTPVDLLVTHKRCASCGELKTASINKDESDFHHNARNLDGYEYYCKMCRKAKSAAYYRKKKGLG